MTTARRQQSRGDGGHVEYRVLGAVDVLRDGEPVDLGSFRQRALMALLLTSPCTVFSTDQIIDALWGDDVGTDRQNSLWVYVSGLRKALEPERKKRSDGTVLLTRSPGYLAQVAPDEIDSGRFERLLAEGRALVDADPAAAGLVLGEALAMWRGRPFEEFTYESWAQPAIARLEGLRLEAIEARIDADLLRGMSRELVSELESLVREHPLQERLTGQLMLALYRSGRQADSLRSYQLLRARLGGELGIEPSLQIRQLEEQIVTGDEALAAGPRGRLAGAEPEPGLAVRGYELRDRLGERGAGILYRAFQPSVGREVAIKVIRPELANDPGFIRRFEAEAQLVARLEHPHIVPLYDYWREPDAAYLVMRLMSGGTLADLLDGGALNPEQAIGVVEQIGSALHTAHRAGVVHRDVRPSNVLIDADGNAYLSDFMIAVETAEEPAGAGNQGAYVAPERVRDGEVAPAWDTYALAVVMAQALAGMSGTIEQIRGALAPEVSRVIDRATEADPRRRHDSPVAFAVELRAALGAITPRQPATLGDAENPYKGLRPFDAADTDDFFGRERLIERLVARLGEPGELGRFVAVVGPSGSGKSSVVRAGLLPAVRQDALTLSGEWFAIEMAPAPHPFEALEEALLGVAVDPPTSLLEQLASGDNGLARTVKRVLPDDGSQLLVMIDQFEELFTQVDPDTASRFLDTIVAAVGDEHSRVRVVVTLRADFYDRPLRHRGLGELLRDGTEVITPMTPEELERAIVGPAERVGVEYDPALVAELVRDVVDRRGALPLLQYALTELFDSRSGNRITAAAYHQLGGVSGALVERAEGLLTELGVAARDVARQVFLRLVTLGEGSEDTRRRVLRSELDQLAVDRRILDGVLETFGRHRLLSFDRDPISRGPTVEISHEALLTEWTRLREWIDAARHDVRYQRRLAQAMEEWLAADRDDEYLLRGGRLDQLHGWMATTSLPLSGPEQAFLDASIAERDRADAEEREREARAVEAEQRERLRVRQLIAAGVVAVLVAGLAVFGVVQWRSADDARASAEDARAQVDRARRTAEFHRGVAEQDRDSLLSRQLADELAEASSDHLADGNPELALALAVQGIGVLAGQRTHGEPIRQMDAAHWALQEMGAQYDVTSNTPIAVRTGPNGRAGVYVLSPADLVAFAESTTDRPLIEILCESEEYASDQCPEPVEVPVDLGGYSPRTGSTRQGGRALAGTTVTLAGGNRDDPGFVRQLEAFTELTGINVDQSGDLLEAARADGDLPDVALAVAPFQPSMQSTMLDLGQFLEPDTLRGDFGDYLVSLGTVGSFGDWPSEEGVIHTIPFHLGLKGLVYYPKAAFDKAGYELPATWAELMALSAQMVADGHSPWCFGYESGVASGWPGTDLIENLVLRTSGVEVYDEWTFGTRPFTSPEVLAAAQLADDLIFEPGFVRNGPGSISTSFYTDPLFPMLQRDPATGEPAPQCWLVTQSDVLFPEVPPNAELGVDLDVFPLPPVGPSRATATTGGVFFAGAFVDRPEVRAFMEFMASPEWGEAWAAEPMPGTFVSPNRRFDPTTYGGGVDSPVVAIQVAMHTELRAAIDAGTFRHDASDLMPGPIGTFNEGFTPGAFWSGMIDWVDGTRTIERVFADIDEAWLALKAAGET